MQEEVKAWLAHMREVYGAHIRRKSEDWLVGMLAILAVMMAIPPLYALVKAWWQLWNG